VIFTFRYTALFTITDVSHPDRRNRTTTSPDRIAVLHFPPASRDTFLTLEQLRAALEHRRSHGRGKLRTSERRRRAPIRELTLLNRLPCKEGQAGLIQPPWASCLPRCWVSSAIACGYALRSRRWCRAAAHLSAYHRWIFEYGERSEHSPNADASS